MVLALGWETDMPRVVKLLERALGATGGGAVFETDIHRINPAGLGNTQVEGDAPQTLLVWYGSDLAGSLELFQGVELADVPGPSPAVPPIANAVLTTTLALAAGAAAQQVVANIVGPFLKIRVTLNAGAATFVRLYVALVSR